MVCGSRIRLIFVIAQSPAECSPSSDRLQQQSRRSGFYNTLVLKHLPDLVRRIAEDDVSPRELRRELNKFYPKAVAPTAKPILSLWFMQGWQKISS
mmetsp:Transcript_21046/g.31223  ORF Transcript_21046/g.31223 Transcript_21046/m.31223 type:complete len:96 (+) Transcript_21046:208-495(+)